MSSKSRPGRQKKSRKVKTRHHRIRRSLQVDDEILPVYGPPNWTEIWYKPEHYGRDWEEVAPPGHPLSLRQMESLKRMTSRQIPKPQRVSVLTDIKFGDLLGKGNNSEVWAVSARKEGLPQRVKLACKVVNNVLQSQADNANYEEMYSLRFANHPHIVTVVDVICIPDQVTGYPFSRLLLFTELCGGTLHDIKRRFRRPKRMSENAAKHWFRQIASALLYLHSKYDSPEGGLDMAHNDIHAGNIYHMEKLGKEVDDKSLMRLTYKLGDFGNCVVDQKIRFERSTQINKAKAKREDVYYLIVELKDCLRIEELPRIRSIPQLMKLSHEYGLSMQVLHLASLSIELQNGRVKCPSIQKVLAHPWLSDQ